MRLLIDQNLPRRLTSLLLIGGHDAVHTEVMADKKLTKFLASSGAHRPSVLITRDVRTLPVEQTSALLIANLPAIEQVIEDRGNAVFSLRQAKPIRAELLPLGSIT